MVKYRRGDRIFMNHYASTEHKPTKMVEVFKTNVNEASEANKITALLLEHFPGSRINFDLHDCDKILRVEGKDFIIEKIMVLVKENGYVCNILE